MNKKFTKLMAALALLVFLIPITGWGQTRDNYNVTYSYSDLGDMLDGSYEDGTSYWKVPATSGNTATIEIPITFQPTSNVTITFRIATYGNGNNPSSSNTTITAVGTEEGSNWSGNGVSSYPSSSTYVNGVMTITKPATPTTLEGLTVTMGVNTGVKIFRLQSITVSYEYTSAAVATPTFNPAGGTYTEEQLIEIECETENAVIYYTTDGTTPDDSSNEYDPDEGVTISETTTLKAIAYMGNDASSVASATYTIVTPLNTMQAIFDRATEIGNTAQTVNITFNNWVVSGKSTSYAYVTDGTKGFVITNYGGHGFNAGDVLSGTASCLLRLNYGYANLQNFTSSATGLTVTSGGTVSPANIDMAELSGVNSGALVHYDNLTCSKSNNNCYLTDGTTTIQVYTTLYSGFTSILQDGKNYNITGVYQQYNTTKEICPRSAADIVEYVGPSIEATPSPFTSPSYVVGTAEPTYNVLTVNGSNLTANISLTLNANSDFEMSTDLDTWSSSLTLTQTNGSVTDEEVAIRLKAGLAKGNYTGTVTLSSTDAQNVVVDLSGSVTGQMYNIVLTQPATGGTIASDLAAAEEGATVHLTATPDAAYNFGSWVVEDENENPITVTDNQFEMPAGDVLVTATFTLKDTYAITCIVTPNDAALMEASPASAYEGQTVTLSYTAETGYTFSGIVITKTLDGSVTGITATASGDDFIFTMPGYAVTVTATFISDTYEGSFAEYSGNLTEGDYLIVYNNNAMNNVVTSNKFGYETVSPSQNGIVANPSRNIVWHIAPSATEGYWTIYNAKMNQYVNATANSTNLGLVDNATYSSGAKWSVTEDESTYDFRCKGNEDLTSGSTVRYIRHYNNVYGHYAASNGGPLTLYKYTVLTERTITFNGNGGTYNNETTYTQTVYDGIAENLDANKFTKAGSAFIGWSTTANGEVEYADEASITVNGDLTLYAQWATSYTAMVDDQIVGGTVKVNSEDIVEVAAGTEMTLTYTSNTSYAFRGWNVYKNGDETIKVTVTGNTFEMPEYDVIVSATFENVTTYSLVTDVNQIVSGKHYIIASGYFDNVKVMASQTDNNRTSVDAYASWDDGVIEETEGIYEFVINGPNTDNYYTIYDVVNGGYLYAAGSGSGKNYLRNQASNDENGLWSFNIDNETGAAEVVAQGSNTNKYMRFNNTLFSCYASTSSIQNPVYLFVKDNDNDYEYYGCEVTYAETSIEGSITIGAGSVMTITNSEFSNDDPAKLIIEDGGQLYTEDVVEATIKKNISAYDPSLVGQGVSNGWYFISYPLNTYGTNGDNPTSVTNMISSSAQSYDLYLFDGTGEGYGQEIGKEWVNYKGQGHTQDFFLCNGHGYLYANANDVTLEFAGSLNFRDPDNDFVSLDNTGWNLVGNPFAYNTYPSLPYYKMNDAGTGIEANEYTTADAVAPCTGILVNSDAGLITFSKNAPSGAKGSINLALAKNERGAAQMDNAILSFNEGSQLGKFYFGTQNANLYIPQGIEEYAIVNTEAQGEMPVNFRANEDGQYTLTVNPENVDMNYLHLIDNMTGMDIDLLQTPSYTFSAATRDYESRFKLVFAANGTDEADESSFAFFSNGNLIVNNEGNATLQVIDINGRILSSESISGSCSKAINATTGVYMLRLINGENVKVQKVVVR